MDRPPIEAFVPLRTRVSRLPSRLDGVISSDRTFSPLISSPLDPAQGEFIFDPLRKFRESHAPPELIPPFLSTRDTSPFLDDAFPFPLDFKSSSFFSFSTYGS